MGDASEDNRGFAHLVAGISADLIGHGDLDAKISDALKQIGEFSGADRAYLFRSRSGADSLFDNTHEWCATGIEPQMPNLKGIQPARDMPWLWEKLHNRESVRVPSVASLPSEASLEKQHFEKQNILSLVVIPLIRDDNLAGWLGLDFVRAGRAFAPGIVDLLAAAGGAIVNALDRKRMEDELRESEARYRGIVENISDSMVIHDFEGTIVDVNEIACATSGYSRREVIGANLRRFHSPENIEDTRQRLALLLDRGELTFECLLLRADGAQIPAEVRTKVVSREGNGLVQGFWRDITDRKAMEEKLRQSQKIESLGVLAGGIAHDFNNILMAVLGHAELALDDLPPASPARGDMREIINAVHRASELCRQMLAYAGKAALTFENMDLCALVDDMAQLLRASISKKAILNLGLDRATAHVRADAGQIRQALLSLATNASEAMGERTGVITISTRTGFYDEAYLRESAHTGRPPAGLYSAIEVADTGCGMDAATIARIFDPFYTTKFAGRGLGLPSVLGIVRAHKGALKVHSAPDKGATFTMLLPAIAEQPVKPAIGTGTADAKAMESRGKGAILLADDEKSLRLLGAKMLEMMGFQAITAADGREAVGIYRERGKEIALVILDLTMPHMDGAEAMEEIHKLNPDARVIIASGYMLKDIAARFPGKGFAGALQKPYSQKQLAHLLEKLGMA